ncbi:MAG TPA: hypothetical protein VMF13_00990 [Luteitalea sp.]|nr:hypothetical protein [Luteitalea sp.]
MSDLTPVLIVATVFGAISFLAWVIVDGIRRKRELQVTSAFHDKLLDRMSNARELAEFMDSPGGSKFIDTISVERTHPGQRILRAVQVGIVLCSAGIGCRMVSWQQSLLDPEAVEGFMILGILLLSIGVGYLVSAVASFVLQRTLGLNDSVAVPTR